MTITRGIWILILLPIAFFLTASAAFAQEATVVEVKSATSVDTKAQVNTTAVSVKTTSQSSSEVLDDSVKTQSLDHEAIISEPGANSEAVEGALNAAFIYTNGARDIESSQANLGSVWVATGEMVSVAHVLARGIDLSDFRRSCNCEERGAKFSPPVVTQAPITHFTSLHTDNLSHGLDFVGQVFYVGQANGLNFILLSITFALIVFFYSWYLRFRSGIAPGRALVIS